MKRKRKVSKIKATIRHEPDALVIELTDKKTGKPVDPNANINDTLDAMMAACIKNLKS